MLLHEKLKNRKLILASRSPRRRELMMGAGLDFVVADNYEVDETFPAEMPAKDVARYLAVLKSEAYPAPLADGEILITADTVVIVDGRVLGKPQDRSEAIAMLEMLSGREHHVITGVALRGSRKRTAFSAGSRVVMRRLGRDEIEYYVDTYRPYDKAGAYGIQEWIGYVGIKGIRGSFYNVMGLPVQTLYTKLAAFV